MGTKIKRAKLFDLKPVLEGMTGEKFKFTYAVAKNLRKVKTEIEDSQKAIEPTPEMKEYEKQRVELCRENSLMENGEPAIRGNRFDIDPAKKAEFEAEMEKLREKYKAGVDSRQKSIDSFNEALNDEVEIEFHNVSIEDVPKNIKPSDLEMILDWVKENDTKQDHNPANPK